MRENQQGLVRDTSQSSAQATLVEASVLSDKLVKAMGWIHPIGRCIAADECN